MSNIWGVVYEQAGGDFDPFEKKKKTYQFSQIGSFPPSNK